MTHVLVCFHDLCDGIPMGETVGDAVTHARDSHGVSPDRFARFFYRFVGPGVDAPAVTPDSMVDAQQRLAVAS